VLDLAFDTFDQGPREKIIGQDYDLGHPQQPLALDHPFQAGMSDPGEGDIHQVVAAGLEKPAGHLGHLAISHGVR